MPLVTISIVTPSFNQGEFLAETIESVLHQEGKFSLDYIIIDGGSTDESVAIIREYERRLALGTYAGKCAGISFRWVSEPDKGQADAIAKGFRMATGDILCWLNSDDVFYPGALQRVTGYLSVDEGCGCVYGRAMYTDVSGTALCEYPTKPFDIRILPAFCFFCQPATFFRKEAYEAVGGVDISLRFSMDYDLWIRMTKVTRFHYLPELLATYRLHAQSKTVSPADSVANHAEGLATAVRHFGWAPASRVYGYCSFLALSYLPAPINRIKPVRGLVASLHTIFLYLRLNRGLNRNDLRLFNFENLWKYLSGQEDVTVTASRENPPQA